MNTWVEFVEIIRDTGLISGIAAIAASAYAAKYAKDAAASYTSSVVTNIKPSNTTSSIRNFTANRKSYINPNYESQSDHILHIYKLKEISKVVGIEENTMECFVKAMCVKARKNGLYFDTFGQFNLSGTRNEREGIVQNLEGVMQYLLDHDPATEDDVKSALKEMKSKISEAKHHQLGRVRRDSAIIQFIRTTERIRNHSRWSERIIRQIEKVIARRIGDNFINLSDNIISEVKEQIFNTIEEKVAKSQIADNIKSQIDATFQSFNSSSFPDLQENINAILDEKRDEVEANVLAELKKKVNGIMVLSVGNADTRLTSILMNLFVAYKIQDVEIRYAPL